MKATTLESYDRWLEEHLEELIEEYAGKVIAVYEGKVITTGDSEAEVYRTISGKELAETPFVFRVPTEEDIQSVLLKVGSNAFHFNL